MLRAAVVAAVGVSVWLLWRGRAPTTSCYRLKMVSADGTVSVLGPKQLTAEQAVEWEVDMREQYWGSTVKRVGC